MVEVDSSKIIIHSIKQFIDKKTINIAEYRENPQVVHYYKEIIRFWSKLNFLVNKTIRSLGQSNISDSEDKARYSYATYKIMWEKSTPTAIIKELNLLKEGDFYNFLNKLQTFSWNKALVNKTREEILSIKESVPSFFIKHLLPVMSFDLIKENVFKMNDISNKKESTLRINNMKLFNHYMEKLQSLGIEFRQDQEIPELIHIPNNKKHHILKNNLTKSGDLLFQDKASATVVKVLDPMPNDFICDMCAAPGIKTSLIAQYSNNQAIIIAGEFLSNRAKELKKIINHLKVMNASLINTDSIKFPIRHEKLFDRVLLDAPCTGSGTFLSNPELKWRQNHKFLAQNITLQEKLLDSAIKMVKPGGILVYSTCSLYPDEGELQINKFKDKLIPLNLPEWLSSPYNIKNHECPGSGRLFPSIHDTQGFFIGKYRID